MTSRGWFCFRLVTTTAVLALGSAGCSATAKGNVDDAPQSDKKCPAAKANQACPAKGPKDRPAAEKKEEFVTLFDGAGSTGWEVWREDEKEINPNAFVIEDDGVLHCTGYDRGHWYRYKAEQFGDFVLRLQYKVPKGGNSGVCVRTQEKGVPWQTGFEVQLLDDYGQDPTLVSAGSIYDVVNPMYNASKPAGEWNDMEITCHGKLVKVVLNGFKVIDTDFSKLTEPRGKYATAYNDLPLKGYIALQDHGQESWYRNIRIKKLQGPPPTPKPVGDEGWLTLFDGQDTEGWEIWRSDGKDQPDAFILKDGVIRCTGKGGYWFRYRAREFKDFILDMDVRVDPAGTTPKGNSGICLRTPDKGEPPFVTFEVQILNSHGKPPHRHHMGAIYDVVVPMYDAAKPAGEWNHFTITCDGPLCTVVLNGWKIIDTDFSKLTEPRGKFDFPYCDLPRSGEICLQDHWDIVEYRNIRVKPLHE